MIEVKSGIDQLKGHGLLSAWSAAECESMLRQRAGDRPLRSRDFESLLARHYPLGLGARSKNDNVLILSTAGCMGYVPDRPLVACLSKLTSEVTVHKHSDHAGVLIDSEGKEHAFDLIHGLTSVTDAFNAALQASGQTLRVFQSGMLRHRGDDSLVAWLVREPNQITGDLVAEIFAA